MKPNLIIRSCIILSLSFLFACSHTEINVPQQEQTEESVFIVQLSNKFAAYDWMSYSFKWETNPVAPSQFVKAGDPFQPTWYRIGLIPRVSLQSWADSSKLVSVSQPEFITIFDPITGQRLGGMPNQLAPDFFIEKPFSEMDGSPHDGRLSRVAIADDKSIVLRGNHQRSKPTSYTIHSLDLKSGDILWTYHLPDQEILNTSFHDGKMYIGCQNSSFVLDMATGKKVKEYPLAGVRVVGDKHLFFWVYGKKLTVADIMTGQIKWELGTDGGTDVVGEMFVSGQTALFTFNGALHAVGADSGVQKWIFADLKLANYEPRKRILIDKQTVFVADQQLRINALDTETGTRKWQSVSFQAAEFDGSDMSMVAGKNKLYVQQRRDQIITLDLTTGDHSSGQTFWAADQGSIRDFMILY